MFDLAFEGGGRAEQYDLAIDTSAIEPVSAQVIEQVAMLAFLAAYDWCQEEKWCDSIHRLDSLDHLIASLRSDFRIAFRAKTGADPGE